MLDNKMKAWVLEVSLFKLLYDYLNKYPLNKMNTFIKTLLTVTVYFIVVFVEKVYLYLSA